MMLNQWLVALEAQMIFHYIFRDVNEKVFEYLASIVRTVLKMDSFADTTSELQKYTCI